MFFCSSRRRHTRCLSDWSSDVCSSDLARRPHQSPGKAGSRRSKRWPRTRDTRSASRSEERRVGKSVDLGGRRIIKKKKKKKKKRRKEEKEQRETTKTRKEKSSANSTNR